MPTILEAAGVPEPKSVDGVEQQPVDGISFLAASRMPKAPEPQRRSTSRCTAIARCTTMAGSPRSAPACCRGPTPARRTTGRCRGSSTISSEDYSEANNLAATNPAKLAADAELFRPRGRKNHVYPIDPRINGRQHPNPPPPGGRAFYTFYPGAPHLYDAFAPGTRNRTHTFTAYVTIPPGGADGVLVAEGGEAAGYSLYIKDGHPAYTYNYFRRERHHDRPPAIRCPQATRSSNCTSPTTAAGSAKARP